MVTVVARWARNEIRQHIQIAYISLSISLSFSLSLLLWLNFVLRATELELELCFTIFTRPAPWLHSLCVCVWGSVMAAKVGGGGADRIAAIILLDDFR